MPHPPAAEPRSKPGNTGATQLAALALLFGLGASLLLFEIGTQLVARFFIYPGLDATIASPLNYYTASDDAVLGYTLRPNTAIDREDRRLWINRHGIRERSEETFADRRRVATLGDSVTFGIGHTQDATITARVQELMSAAQPPVKSLNFGTPGYNLDELLRFFQLKDDIYDVDDVVLLLNPNDFSRRNTRTEGADNALYRSYRRPFFTSPFFVRKAIYRAHKDGHEWYRWMFEAGGEHGLDVIETIAAEARRRNARFGVVLLPAGSAYHDGVYALDAMYDRIAERLGSADIRFRDPRTRVEGDAAHYFDATDHLTDAGNDLIAEEIVSLFAEPSSQRTAKAR